MDKISKNLVDNSQKGEKKSLALNKSDVLEFRKYTQSVWSKVAGRPISEGEADQIIENFGRFLQTLASEKKGRENEEK